MCVYIYIYAENLWAEGRKLIGRGPRTWTEDPDNTVMLNQKKQIWIMLNQISVLYISLYVIGGSYVYQDIWFNMIRILFCSVSMNVFFPVQHRLWFSVCWALNLS